MSSLGYSLTLRVEGNLAWFAFVPTLDHVSIPMQCQARWGGQVFVANVANEAFVVVSSIQSREKGPRPSGLDLFISVHVHFVALFDFAPLVFSPCCA